MPVKQPSAWLLWLLPAFLAGCPFTDDYFIDEGSSGGMSGSGTAGRSVLPMLPSAGTGGTATGGTAPAAGEDGAGGVHESLAGSAPVMGGAPGACTPTTERCNGHDDDCDRVVDEQACNSPTAGTMGCSGFVLDARPDHGYMLCTGMTRDYARAQEACRSQGMRLAWLESQAENEGVSSKVAGVVAGLEVWVGATDQEMEGIWGWDGQGGRVFWGGTENGNPVDGAYVAWGEATPNNSEQYSPQGEDCAVLMSTSATWGDRTCSIKYAYLCEEPEPQ